MKKRQIQLCTAIAALVLTMTSCELEIHSNGDLDGFWHLTHIDSLQTGGTKDMSNDRVFWSVQKELMTTKNFDIHTYEILYHFEHKGDSLIMFDPMISARNKGDIPLSSPDSLRQFGINEIKEHFFVEKLNGSNMILKSNKLRLYLKSM